MNELSRDARTLIDRANSEERPAPGVSDRARKNIAAAIAAGATTTAASATAASKVGLSLGVKIVLVTMVAGGVGTGTWLLATDRTPPERSADEVVPAPEADTTKVVVPEADETQPASKEAKHGLAKKRVKSKRPPVLTPEALARETDLLERAQLALNAGEPARALDHLERHAEEFPRGALRRERMAAWVFALCELGQVGRARQRAGRFLRDFPEGPLAERVRSSCGGPVE